MSTTPESACGIKLLSVKDVPKEVSGSMAELKKDLRFRDIAHLFFFFTLRPSDLWRWFMKKKMNKNLIPDGWKGKFIIFIGTVERDDAHHGVTLSPYMRWDEEKRDWAWGWEDPLLAMNQSDNGHVFLAIKDEKLS